MTSLNTFRSTVDYNNYSTEICATMSSSIDTDNNYLKRNVFREVFVCRLHVFVLFIASLNIINYYYYYSYIILITNFPCHPKVESNYKRIEHKQQWFHIQWCPIFHYSWSNTDKC